MQTLLYSAILITGGFLSGANKASIYIPSAHQSCILPDLPTRRTWHSQVGLRACGGNYYEPGPFGGQTIANTNCDTWNSETGLWNTGDVQLIGVREGNSWTTANGEGTYLIGGFGFGGYGAYDGGNEGDNGKSTDLLKPDGTVVPGFNTTMYIGYAINQNVTLEYL